MLGETSRRYGALIGIALIAGGIIAGAAIWLAMDDDTSQYDAASLTLGVYAGDTSSLVYVAQEQEFFEEYGLNVTLREHDSGKAAYDSLLAGDVDMATAAEFVFVSNSFTHHNLSIMGSIATTEELIKVAARRDHGIHTPADLTGMSIGVTRKSAGEFFLGVFFIYNHLDIQDVTLVDLSPPHLVDNLTKGSVDAVCTWEPNIYHVQQRLGGDAIIWPAQSGQEFYFVLASHDAWIANNTGVAERLLAALVDAERYIASHESAARQYIEDYFNYTSAYLDVVWPIQQFRVTLPQALLLAMEQEAGWLIEEDLTAATAVPNYYGDIYQQGLLAVQPDAVTILGGRR